MAERNVCIFAEFNLGRLRNQIETTAEPVYQPRVVKEHGQTLITLIPAPSFEILPAAMCSQTFLTVGTRIRNANLIEMHRVLECPIKDQTTAGCIQK